MPHKICEYKLPPEAMTAIRLYGSGEAAIEVNTHEDGSQTVTFWSIERPPAVVPGPRLTLVEKH
jgi:hypothetical protein